MARFNVFMNGDFIGEATNVHFPGDDRPSYGDHPHTFRQATGEEIIPPGVPITRPWAGMLEGMLDVTPPKDRQRLREQRRERRKARKRDKTATT